MTPEAIFVELFEEKMRPIKNPKRKKNYGIWWKGKRWGTPNGKYVWAAQGYAMSAISIQIKWVFETKVRGIIGGICSYEISNKIYEEIVKKLKKEKILEIRELDS